MGTWMAEPSSPRPRTVHWRCLVSGAQLPLRHLRTPFFSLHAPSSPPMPSLWTKHHSTHSCVFQAKPSCLGSLLLGLLQVSYPSSVLDTRCLLVVLSPCQCLLPSTPKICTVQRATGKPSVVLEQSSTEWDSHKGHWKYILALPSYLSCPK